jgi:hypothetical protein
MAESDQINILEAVNRKVDRVRTRSLDLSFNELLDMYETGELTINPDYQRLFRWSDASQSRFIESLILEMPIPPVFVIEGEEGKYELIDGLQRLGSYIRFRGRYKGPSPTEVEEDFEIFAEDEPESETVVDGESASSVAPNNWEDSMVEISRQQLKLVNCDIVPELDGHSFDSLPQALQIKLKRNFIRVEVLRKETSQAMRYYMFKRLNTGGAKLSKQEERNCIIRLLGITFNDFIIKLSRKKNFMLCTKTLSVAQKQQKYDQELVLRFFAFKNNRAEFVHDVGDFMTEYMERVSDERNEGGNRIAFDYIQEEETFDKTFEILAKTLGTTVFSGISKTGKAIQGFATYHFEAITLGIQKYVVTLDPTNTAAMAKIKEGMDAIKRDISFQEATKGGGRNTPKLLKQRIEIVEKFLESYV